MNQNKNEFPTEVEEIVPLEIFDIIDSKKNIFKKNKEIKDIIEAILISIYKHLEKSKIEKLNIDRFQNEIKSLCSKYKKEDVVFLLLKSIHKLINRYMDKIFNLDCYIRSNSHEIRASKFTQNRNSFKLGNSKIYRSYYKYKSNYNYLNNLFSELYNIKIILKKSAPIIEKVFETPLSSFEKLSIEECEKKEYLKKIINNKFIWNEIISNREAKFNKLINEIIEGNDLNSNIMTDKNKFFDKIIQNSKKDFDRVLKIAEIGSSIDEKYPEEAEPIDELKFSNFNNFINGEDNKSNSNSNYFLSTEGEVDNIDFDIIDTQNIKDNNLTNINMIHFENNINSIEEDDFITEKDNETFNTIKERYNLHHQTETLNQNIITNQKIKGIHSIDISENNKFLDMPNLFVKNNKNNNNNKENIEKAFSFNIKNNIHNKVTNINNQINNTVNFKSKKYVNILNDERIIKGKEQFLFKNIKNSKNKNKKDNNENKFSNKNKNYKIDKKEIPSDIDDLVKYIVNDDKKETQNKKKKKNKKKTKKKNKAEVENNKEETNIEIEDKKEKEENDEINEVKQNLLENSINRFKIHKIKFKYSQKWLEKITKDQ